MAITWKQIDTNGNGYVDGHEAQTAKQKGVKNIWNNMTQSDYKNGITLEQKYSTAYSAALEISKKYNVLGGENFTPYRFHLTNEGQENTIGVYRVLEQKRNKLEKLQKEFDNEFSDLEGAWYSVKYGTEDLINKLEKHGNMIKFDKNERVHKYFSYKSRINQLEYEVKCGERNLCRQFR